MLLRSMPKRFTAGSRYFDSDDLEELGVPTTSADPTVSIGLPVYNGARYLRQTLDSIVSQTFRDFEVIISDNGSVDATGEICREYAARDPRIRYYRNDENHGASWNYKRVFELARGKYFRWAPADDCFAPESVQQCVAVLEAHPEVVLCYPQTILIDSTGSTIRAYADNLDARESDPVARFRKVRDCIGLVNILYGLLRVDSLKRTALLGSYPGADIVLVLELSLYGQFYEIPMPLFFRRMHEHASSSIKTVAGVQEFFDPKSKGKFFLRSWTHQSYLLVAILRAPLSLLTRMQLVGYLLRCTISIRHVLIEELVEAVTRTFGGSTRRHFQ